MAKRTLKIFLKHAWSFYNIMHERVKAAMLLMCLEVLEGRIFLFSCERLGRGLYEIIVSSKAVP